MELEKDAVSALPTAEIEGLDLTVLQQTLVPMNLIEESDKTWSFEGKLVC